MAQVTLKCEPTVRAMGDGGVDAGTGWTEDAGNGWHCIITGHFETGTGASRYTQYRAQSTMPGQPSQELVFRFSQVNQMRQDLRRMPDLNGIEMPRMPPKWTLRTMVKGRFDSKFLQQRQALMQQFFDGLSTKLNQKYGEVGNVLDLCEVLGNFVRRAADSGCADERAAIEAVDSYSHRRGSRDNRI